MPIEAPNNLLSTGTQKIIDLLCEGQIKGFVVKSGVSGASPLASTYFDNVTVINTDGSTNFNTSGQGFSFGYTLGTPTQVLPDPFGKVETLVPLSYNTRVAYPPDGAGPKKDVIVSFNTDQYPDADSIRITLRVPSLMTTNNDSKSDKYGDTDGYNIVAKVEISLNGGPFAVPIQYGQGIFSIIGKCASPYLYDINMVLPKTYPASSRYDWKVRISRVSRNIISLSTQNELFVEAVSIISSNSFRYPNTVVVCQSLSAEQFATFPSRAYEVDGLLLKVPSGYTPTVYNVDGTITAATYPTVWDGTWSSSTGELLRNGMFSLPAPSDWSTGPNVFSFTTETANPPPGETQYAKVIANGSSSWILDPYQPSFSASIITGNKYTVTGWYKTSSKEGNLEVRIKSDDPSFELVSATDWTYFEQEVTAGNGSWLSWRWIIGRNTVAGTDVLYLAGLSVKNVNGGRVWSNNPAWVFYDLITNKRYGLGRYVQEANIDKWTLYKIAQYCDELVDDGKGGLEPRFTFNAAIQTRIDAYQLLQNFVSVFQGMIYWASDRIITSQVRDTRETQIFTNADVIDGKFSYSDTAKNTRSTVIKVKYMNPDNFYKEAVEIIEDIDGIARYGYVEKEITAFACTSRGQAIRMANWVLLTERYMTETVTFQVGLEGIWTAPGDIFSLYDNFRKNSQQGGRVMAFDTNRTAITLDRQVYLRSGYNYQLSATVPKASYDLDQITGSDQIDFIRNSQVETRSVTTPAGYATTLGMDSGFSTGIYPGSIWLLSATGTNNVLAFAQKYRCLATSEPSRGIVEVLGVEWNTGINYRVDTGYNILPNPINSGDGSGIAPPTNLTISLVTGAYASNNVYTYLGLNWNHSPSSNRSNYEISGRREPSGYQLLNVAPDNSYNYNIFNSGVYDFSIRAVSAGGQFSTPMTGQYIVASNNPFGQPPALSSISVISGQDKRLGSVGYFGNTFTVSWTLPTGQFGLDAPETNYISGYIFHAMDPSTSTDLMPPVYLTGVNNNQYTLTWAQINSFTGIGATRSIKTYVQTFDTDRVIRSGVSAIMVNPACSAADN
jgi:predicted phage tail protein